MRTRYPVTGSALPATSGTWRPRKCFETPPPVADCVSLSSHVTSAAREPSGLRVSFVPPQPTTFGLEAGKSTVGELVPSSAPVSPEAANTTTPFLRACANTVSNAAIVDEDHEDSGPPHEIDTTSHSATACLIAARKPWSVFGAKYTRNAAPGAIAPATSMSSSTSPSAPLGPSGWLTPPATSTAVTDGAGRLRPAKYASRSAWLKPPPSSMRPHV